MKLRKILRKLGLRPRAQVGEPERVVKLMQTYNIDMVLDVGANEGQYAKRIRAKGYKGKIISFEPQSAVYRDLVEAAKQDPNWDTRNIALGNEEGEAVINISQGSGKSSLLRSLPIRLDTVMRSNIVGTETVKCKTLDSVIDEIPGNNLWLKLDVEGFEKFVLAGATKALEKIDSVQIEMQYVPLFDGSATFVEMYRFLDDHGYTLVHIIPGFVEPTTGQQFQSDGIFHRFQR